jgi:hypothetical protein
MDATRSAADGDVLTRFAAQATLALRDPREKSKAGIAVAKALFSVAKTVAQGSLDKELLSNFATIGRWGRHTCSATRFGHCLVEVSHAVIPGNSILIDHAHTNARCSPLPLPPPRSVAVVQHDDREDPADERSSHVHLHTQGSVFRV